MLRVLKFFGLAAVVALTACSTTPVTEPESGEGQPIAPELLVEETVKVGSVSLARKTFDEVTAAESRDWQAALKAFRISCRSLSGKDAWRTVCGRALLANEARAREFFESSFDLYSVTDAELGSTTGLMTGYYEPLLRASLKRHGPYRWPVYGVPEDLIVVDLAGQYPQLKGLRLRGKVSGRKLVPYDDRKAITRRADLRKNNVLCWADDPVEVFFLQVQGSGRILLDDGSFMRVGYGDTNGHPYRGIGGWLIQNAGLTREEMSMQRIKRWVKDNPGRTEELLNTNPNFIFFEERKGFADDEGPVGAQGVPLTAGASVAVDRRYWPLGLPFIVAAEQDNPPLAFVRPVIAQDTGGAIKGVIRFDYFWGYGDAAGESAGAQKSRAQAWVMIPKGVNPAEILTR